MPAGDSTGLPRCGETHLCHAVVVGPFVVEEAPASLRLPTQGLALGIGALALVLGSSRKQRRLLPLSWKEVVWFGNLSRDREPSVADAAELKAPLVSKRILQKQQQQQ